MKELIGIAVLLVGLFGGTIVLKKIHDQVRVAALTKAAQGLPSLSKFASQLTSQRKQQQSNKQDSK